MKTKRTASRKSRPVAPDVRRRLAADLIAHLSRGIRDVDAICSVVAPTRRTLYGASHMQRVVEMALGDLRQSLFAVETFAVAVARAEGVDVAKARDESFDLYGPANPISGSG